MVNGRRHRSVSASSSLPGGLPGCSVGFWILLAAFCSAAQAAEHQHAPPQVLAPGYADLEFVPPPPGSYQLPPFARAADARLLDSNGSSVSLHGLYRDHLVLLSFIYTRCSDVNGCPLATHVLGKLQQQLRTQSDLRGQLRLISISFDPDYDTPAIMASYREAFAIAGADKPDDWYFLTAPSEAALAAVLEDYNQWVFKDYDDAGNYLGSLSHLLRVYLIDRQQRIRNIYSVSFLHADTIANDVRTLLLEEKLEGSLPGKISSVSEALSSLP